MNDRELFARLKRQGTPAALARLERLKFLHRAATSREWTHGRPTALDPELFDTTPEQEEESND